MRAPGKVGGMTDKTYGEVLCYTKTNSPDGNRWRNSNSVLNNTIACDCRDSGRKEGILSTRISIMTILSRNGRRKHKLECDVRLMFTVASSTIKSPTRCKRRFPRKDVSNFRTATEPIFWYEPSQVF